MGKSFGGVNLPLLVIGSRNIDFHSYYFVSYLLFGTGVSVIHGILNIYIAPLELSMFRRDIHTQQYLHIVPLECSMFRREIHSQSSLHIVPLE